ncbi:MAG: hypothetical protein J6J06_02035 [Bacteroidaceae bacterium]|nr:hypothetical protein [Bacteroidaceae bacterium]
MDKIKKLIHCILYDRSRLLLAVVKRIGRLLPDKLYLKILFRLYMGYPLNLDNPQTFSEKLQWLKLYNRRPEYTQMVDKYEAKKYVASIIGDEYIIPTLGVWNNVDEIDFDSLPNQFVIKTTHGGGSGGVVICRDKAKFDIEACKRKLKQSMRHNIYYSYREWPYKNVKPRIIAELYISDNVHDDLPDYKFYCFDGVPKYCQVIKDRNTHETIDFFDTEWSHQNFCGLIQLDDIKKISNSVQAVNKPINYREMIECARKLSADIPFSRIDMYNIQEKFFFGEITFYPASGLGQFYPQEWDYKLGKMIELPTKS